MPQLDLLKGQFIQLVLYFVIYPTHYLINSVETPKVVNPNVYNACN